jgi:hypothetical protein
MKQQTDREMDLMLRRHLRRGAKGAPAGPGGGGNGDDRQMKEALASSHLDADELSAYAENALPQAARARYTAHLADCDECRSIVVDLAVATNIVSDEKVREAAHSASPSRSWREWLAAVFAPPMMRYAVPAVVLLCVAGIAFVAMRVSKDEASYVAENRQPTTVAPNANTAAAAPEQGLTQSDRQTEGAEKPPASTSAQTNGNVGEADSAATTRTEDVQPKEKAAQPEVAQDRAAPQLDGVTTDSSGATVDKRAIQELPKLERQPQTEEEKQAAAKTAPSDMPPPAPVGRAKGQDEAARLSREQRGNRPSSNTTTVTNEVTASQAGKRDNKGADGATYGAGPEPDNRRARSTSKAAEPSRSERADRISSKDSNASSETRSVGGRRFRRQGNAWIDTAYNASRSTINVARGSEQYRALVADEPAIANIANQLGGEVIVVWKGKAYRIR